MTAKKTFTLVTALTICSFAAAGKYAAVVNGRKITKSHIEKMMWTAYGQASVQNAINEELMLEKAQILNITADKKEVEKQYGEIKSQYGSDKEFEKTLKEKYLTPKGLKEQIKKHQIKSKLTANLKRINITDADAENFFEKNKEAFAKPASVLLKQIVVKTKAEADAIWQELKNGVKFEDIAAKKSLDLQTGKKGGEIGWVSENQLIDKIAKIVFTLKAKEYSRPIKTPNGYYILKTEEKKEKIPAKYDDKTKNMIKENLLRNEIAKETPKVIKNLRKEAKIEVYI